VVTALGGFIALRALIALFVRQHFIAPITHTYPINVSSVSGRLAHSWWLVGYLTDPSGHNSSAIGIRIPTACQTSVYKQFETRIGAHGFHRVVTYQPADRFWTFQAIEAGIFVILAAALLAFAYRRITTVDA
jgi:hypothetical protein